MEEIKMKAVFRFRKYNEWIQIAVNGKETCSD